MNKSPRPLPYPVACTHTRSCSEATLYLLAFILFSLTMLLLFGSGRRPLDGVFILHGMCLEWVRQTERKARLGGAGLDVFVLQNPRVVGEVSRGHYRPLTVVVPHAGRSAFVGVLL